MIFIGDVHGKVSRYKSIVDRYDASIQVGDFGFKKEHDWYKKHISPEHKINFGNHDYYPYLNENYSCGNHSYDNGIFTIRGADSIDRKFRIDGVDWFRDEELSYLESLEVIDAYRLAKPEIVCSHDCPQSVCEELFGHPPSFTRKLLDYLLSIHQPLIWVFGHHHQSIDTTIGSTRFKCLAALETFEL